MRDDVRALSAEARTWDTPEIRRHVSQDLLDALIALADALEAATVAPAVDREALATVLAAGSALDGASDETVGQFGERLADAILASGLLRDVRDVQAEALEQAATEREWLTGATLRARAQAIREARSER